MHMCALAVPQTGVLIRGNLRADRSKVFAALCDKVRELFGDKYQVLMVEDPEAYSDGGAPSSSTGSGSSSSGAGSRGGSSGAATGQAEPRVAFQVGAGNTAMVVGMGVWGRVAWVEVSCCAPACLLCLLACSLPPKLAHAEPLHCSLLSGERRLLAELWPGG